MTQRQRREDRRKRKKGREGGRRVEGGREGGRGRKRWGREGVSNDLMFQFHLVYIL